MHIAIVLLKSMSAIARQRLDFLVVILVLVLLSQRDVPVWVPGQDGEAASIEAAVIKPSEGAARAYRDRLYVIPVEEVDRMPPFKLHLERANYSFKPNMYQPTSPTGTSSLHPPQPSSSKTWAQRWLGTAWQELPQIAEDIFQCHEVCCLSTTFTNLRGRKSEGKGELWI